ncbi:hypothetical protein I314_04097 [Cryptococcus bacillisporus CA1873]|uniref:Uncharacterized protein n=2 Tax=Cryptococcus gattii TaxID=552467 RepID=A0A0D0UFE0_CRYGA|nr:hypothetical protein I312_03914 [Cryptococcus bacillisporus CA1280]KIR60241.1 hypothetical protein I314_04097 [Cryptococcus bacillisporus CA1873]|eukprot:KIR60241.1 hypothetical protein I314_04097 [Cryptococcus gattii CA1873]
MRGGGGGGFLGGKDRQWWDQEVRVRVQPLHYQGSGKKPERKGPRRRLEHRNQ